MKKYQRHELHSRQAVAVEQHPMHDRLQELCDANDLDGVLALVTLDEFADAWWRQQRARAWENDDDDDLGPDSWTHDFFWIEDAYADERIPMHRELIDRLIDRATSEEAGAVGVGPMENLAYDDPETLAWAEQRAGESDVFRAALADMWVADYVSPETFARLEAAAGVELPRPGPQLAEWQRADAARERLEAIGGPKWYLRMLEEPVSPDLAAASDEYLRLVQQALDTSRSESPE
jgi:hypothetical protein